MSYIKKMKEITENFSIGAITPKSMDNARKEMKKRFEANGLDIKVIENETNLGITNVEVKGKDYFSMGSITPKTMDNAKKEMQKRFEENGMGR